MQGQELEHIKQFIILKLDEQLYGVDIKHILVIEKMKAIMHIPKTPNWIKGVINLRGEIIPVICMREKFELEPKPYTDKSRIVIIKLEDDMVGIIVDEVKEVVELEQEEIENIQNVQGKINPNYIQGIGKIENQTNIITLINIKNIIEESFEIKK